MDAARRRPKWSASSLSGPAKVAWRRSSRSSFTKGAIGRFGRCSKRSAIPWFGCGVWRSGRSETRSCAPATFESCQATKWRRSRGTQVPDPLTRLRQSRPERARRATAAGGPAGRSPPVQLVVQHRTPEANEVPRGGRERRMFDGGVGDHRRCEKPYVDTAVSKRARPARADSIAGMTLSSIPCRR